MTAYLEVVWQCHRSHLKGLASGVSKEEAVQRSHDFAEWERLYVARSGEGGEVLTHKDFICLHTFEYTPLGTYQKSIGEVLVRTKPTEYRWRGGIQHKEGHE